MIDFEFTPNMLIVVAAAAFGGLLGGVLTGRRASVFGSILMGTIGGLVATVLTRAADFPPIVEVAGYSIVYAVLGGIVLAAIIGYSSR
jgi:uncharacterized membrane protein YeaQ/YmgE (transglycosylase-associated protein family)